MSHCELSAEKHLEAGEQTTGRWALAAPQSHGQLGRSFGARSRVVAPPPSLRRHHRRCLVAATSTRFGGRRQLGSRAGSTRSELRYAASSIASIAVSGWLMGSTPTRLTIDVMVPSASASTHAARCSNPRYGNPGSSTHPDAAPVHSGNDGVVSDGGCSISNAGG